MRRDWVEGRREEKREDGARKERRGEEKKRENERGWGKRTRGERKEEQLENCLLAWLWLAAFVCCNSQWLLFIFELYFLEHSLPTHD